jgi:hypothetical protein
VTSGGDIVAQGDGWVITRAKLRARLDELSPDARERYASTEKRLEFVDNMIAFEVLLAEARRQGVDRDPEVQHAFQKVVVQRWVQQRIGIPHKDEPDAQQRARAAFDSYVRELKARANIQVHPAAVRGTEVHPEHPE